MSSDGDLTGVRSIRASTKVFLKIFNLTNLDVNVIWLDYDGREQIYYTLTQSRRDISVDTFETHPWIFREKNSGNRLTAQPGAGGPVMIYLPKICIYRGGIARLPVWITYPFGSLKYRCFVAFKEWGLLPESLMGLELPPTLLDDYEMFFKQYLHCRAKFGINN